MKFKLNLKNNNEIIKEFKDSKSFEKFIFENKNKLKSVQILKEDGIDWKKIADEKNERYRKEIQSYQTMPFEEFVKELNQIFDNQVKVVEVTKYHTEKCAKYWIFSFYESGTVEVRGGYTLAGRAKYENILNFARVLKNLQ